MNLQWILNPLTQYGIMAAVLFGTLVLFLGLKFELSAERRKAQRSTADLASRLSDLESAMAGLRKAVSEIEERPQVEAPGINNEKRAIAIRMHMRGESVESIAACLRIPKSGVELLLKVQKMTGYREIPAA